MYAYLWHQTVRPEHRAAFERTYGPDGAWVALFRRDPEYRETMLLRDRHAPARYATLDLWTSREARLRFRERFAADVAALDTACEALTADETDVGDFDLVGRTEEGQP